MLSNVINLNSHTISWLQTLCGTATAGMTKVTKDVSEQVDESPTYFGAEMLQCYFGWNDYIIAKLYLQRQ